MHVCRAGGGQNKSDASVLDILTRSSCRTATVSLQNNEDDTV
jgi:hypothetical protein